MEDLHCDAKLTTGKAENAGRVQHGPPGRHSAKTNNSATHRSISHANTIINERM
jgi:hypothetical protein